MKRIVRIDTIALTYSLHVLENTSIDDVTAKSYVAVDGSVILFANDNPTPKITAQTMANSIIDEDTVNEINSFFKTIPDTFEIEYNDGTIDNVIFDFENPPAFSPIYEGACWYTGTINFYNGGEI